MRVLGAVAAGAIMGVVVVNGGLVPSEAAILRTVGRKAVVDARDNRLAITDLDKWRWQSAGIGDAAAVSPDGIGRLRFEPGVKPCARADRGQRDHIAGRRHKLVPTLVREEGAGRASFHWATTCQGVDIGVLGVRHTGDP